MCTKSSIAVIRVNYMLKAKVLGTRFLSFVRVDTGNDHTSFMYLSVPCTFLIGAPDERKYNSIIAHA